MIKILIYDPNYVKGISRMIPLTKMVYWQKMGADITVFCTAEGKYFYESKIKNLKFITVRFTYTLKGVYLLMYDILRVNLKAIFLLPKLLHRYDIIYSQSAVIDFLIIPWIVKLLDSQIGWFVMVDNLVPPPGKRPGPFLNKFIPYLAFLLGNRLLKKTDGIFVVTDYIRDYYLNLGITNVVKTSDGYGIEADIFKGELSENTPRVNALYCGRLHLAKGILDLVDVIKIVARENPGFKIGILGNGEKSIKEKFYQKIDKSGLKNNFCHFGYVEGKKKGDIYRKADFFLFLSYDESFGHALLEALANNKTVLAYDLPVYHLVFPKFIRSRQLLLFKLKDYEKIAAAILENKFRDKVFNNKVDDYRWDKICEREYQAFQGRKR